MFIMFLHHALGYAVAEGRPMREHRLPCCGVGIGWVLYVSILVPFLEPLFLNFLYILWSDW